MEMGRGVVGYIGEKGSLVAEWWSYRSVGILESRGVRLGNECKGFNVVQLQG